MKKTVSIIALALLALGCKDFLDRQPLDTPSSATFYANEAEIRIGLTGVYNAAFWNSRGNVPDLKRIEGTTDLIISRKTDPESLVAMGNQGPFVIGNAISETGWQQGYRLIARANDLLEGMKRGQARTSKASYDRMRGEALTLRAWAYLNLMTWYGNVVYYTQPLQPDQYETQAQTPKEEIARALYKDLDEAYTGLDLNPAERGRMSKHMALGIKARLAMLIKDYATAAEATNTIIKSGNHSLNPNYQALFTLAGQTANVGREVMGQMMYPAENPNIASWQVVGYTPRQTLGAQSNNFPTQAMVDKFECIDGKRIDESPLYDPANPSRNRDRRLRWTLYMPGDTIEVRMVKAASLPYQNPNQRFIYNIHSDQIFRYNWNTQRYDVINGNPDFVTSSNSVWQFGATGAVGGVGYVWRKYNDPDQYVWELKTPFILMRYAEILLTYAEAKIEQNQIDASVIDAINAVRRRAGQPAATVTDQARLRQLVRRERAVEFATEGLRLFDIRRWEIVKEVLNGPIVGAAINPANVPAIPSFGAKGSVQDLNDIPDYSASIAQRIKSRNETRQNVDKHVLWPIPQGEIDKNKALKQNSGW
ncbi:RagB/SusD family nutrient uptake outer membrane protein [Spirosoma sordidisoli]|uniref:RagB/SusD family nutrient uptake outer membrane protein n=1 Tax=Spirosoma sordidisoli TaxID=2502893 RepID=A0A4Q2UHZ8_9BACT|nr:RagB/SusD family nutrient uptake outer membrane protein [Spirosoma sordidisoli]RYC67115.1 RagB/SusD family nutrient uptake outer membrane protein [Spirosoma sordidisoli]